jgi:hypothetical protein
MSKKPRNSRKKQVLPDQDDVLPLPNTTAILIAERRVQDYPKIYNMLARALAENGRLARQLEAVDKPLVGHLGLVVYDLGEVRREGRTHSNGQPKIVNFDPDSVEWHTFLVAFRAGERGATDEEWRKGYLGEWSARRRRKHAVAEKLADLDTGFVRGSLRLVDLPPLRCP